MTGPRFTPLVLVALSLGACSEISDPLAPAPAGTAAALPASDSDLHLSDVQLRPGVTVDLHMEVFVNEARNSPRCTADKVVFAVPGFAHTAAAWEPYAEALFAARPQQTCALIALDLPGHGDSGLPEGITFGELMLDDYVTATLAALASLAASGDAPATVVAHSQGALVVQMAQQRLVEGGSSLRAAVGTREVQLLAPVPPAEVEWSFAESGLGAQVLGPLVVVDPVLGLHARVPDAFWPVLFFSNLSGQLASGAPSAAAVAALGYNAPAPLYASLQLIGAAPFPSRPSVDAGVFAGRHGTRLSVIAFEQDQLIRSTEAAALGGYLADGRNAASFSLISGTEAVHDLLVSDPAAILRGTRPPLQ